METLLRDLRLAVRKIRKRPAISLAIIVSLGLAIGANASVFSFLNTVLLAELPFEDPDELVRLREGPVEDGDITPVAVAPMTYPVIEESELFQSVAVHDPGVFDLTGEGDPQNVNGGRISHDFFDVLGVQPRIGRGFSEDEDRPGSPAPVVILSDGLWRRQFNSDPDVLGQSVEVDGAPHQIVGVMEPGFKFPYNAELWVPLGVDPLAGDRRGRLYLNVFARLADGVTPERAEEGLPAMTRELRQRDPEQYASLGLTLVTIRQDMVGDVGSGLLVLFLAAGIVLLIAAVNAANLMLAQAQEESTSLSIRVALGSRRRALIRQLMVHSALLGLLAGLFGLVLAVWTLRPLARLSPLENLDFHFRDSLGLDPQIFALGLLISLLVGLAFGLVPALRASRPDLRDLLSEGSRAAGLRSRRWLSGLVVAETALAMVLLAAAGLTFKSYHQLQSVDLGFEADNLVALHLPPPTARYPEPPLQRDFYRRLSERIAALPGVESVDFTTDHGSSGSDPQAPFIIEDRPGEGPGDFFVTSHRVISPGYFQTMGIELQAGRTFNEGDREGGEPVVIVNRSFADTHLGNEPLGKRVRPWIGEYPWMTVVGVVDDIEQGSDYPETWYVPMDQPWSYPDGFLVVRADEDGPEMASAIRQAVWDVDREQPIASIDPMTDLVAASKRQERFSALLYVLFGTLALLVAAVGIYGVLAYGVTGRFREFGIRLALGAKPAEVRRLVLRQALTLTLIGLALGTVAALALTRFLESVLVDVSPTDPVVFGGVLAVLIVVALVASYLPARRASRVDPVEVLTQL